MSDPFDIATTPPGVPEVPDVSGSSGASGVPDWLQPLSDAIDRVRPALTVARPSTRSEVSGPDRPAGRAAAVLMLFGDDRALPAAPVTPAASPPSPLPPSPLPPSEPQPGRVGLPSGADLLLLRRAGTLRSHSGQVAFPGGATDPEDRDAVSTALREAVEETGLEADGVRVFATLDPIYIPPSGFDVTPVLGYWWRPSPVRAMDPGETETVVRVPLRELIDPANRFRVQHPLGYIGAAFEVGGMLVWGFTAGVISAVLDAAGWTIPWPTDDVRDLDRTLDRLAPGSS